MAGPVFLLMFATLPETSPTNILLRCARRRIGDPRLKSQSEINQGSLKIGTVVMESIVRPMEISIKIQPCSSRTSTSHCSTASIIPSSKFFPWSVLLTMASLLGPRAPCSLASLSHALWESPFIAPTFSSIWSPTLKRMAYEPRNTVWTMP